MLAAKPPVFLQRMARQEHDREDLLAEAHALVERAEFQIDACPDPVVAGFRADGQCSIFFHAERVYHFNAQHELRRGFVDSCMFKSELGQLVRLNRRRTDTQVQLVRHEMTTEETRRFLDELDALLATLEAALAGGRVVVLRQVPTTANVCSRLARWLAARPMVPIVATSPRVRD